MITKTMIDAALQARITDYRTEDESEKTVTVSQAMSRYGFHHPFDPTEVVQAIIEAAMIVASTAQPPKFTTEDGPCWHHEGKAYIATVDGDTLQLMITSGARIEFIGDALPFRVPAPTAPLNLEQFREAVDYAARAADFNTHTEIGDQLRKLLVLIGPLDKAALG